MWLCLNNAFLSVVHKDCHADELLVRARRAGDIQRVFPKANVRRTVGVDYLYRATMKRSTVAAAMTKMLMEYEADNFKNSVKDNELHNSYMQIWSIMARTQKTPPYARPNSYRQPQFNFDNA
jgi:hypothetical protein